MNFKKGFTLIELLVVVAIIGILASVVLASLNSARSKGRDAAVFAQLANMRGQAELYYATNNNYGTGYTTLTVASAATGVDITPTGSCITSYATNGGMFTALSSAAGLDGLIKGACASGATAIVASVDAATATKWAVRATGVSANTWYCVDSSGASLTKTTGIYALASAACVP